MVTFTVLRCNRISDPVAVRTNLYALQYGLRKAVAAKTLDELLRDKASLDGDIFAYVRGRVADLGIEVLGVGVKDVILPGEMKEILNGVVQAAKLAEANVIRRREETNATRSALNTATLIEENQTLMLPKELEARPYFGGLYGLLNQLVKFKT
jgi:regulator of protease activity HflC (stomatin/prohibitin superfamily)